ncbi:MAG: hypothetical protein M3P34_07525 [Actinomycetota bacterium]|nr:hypothetical protein [Actinomycetota bacterium]
MSPPQVECGVRIDLIPDRVAVVNVIREQEIEVPRRIERPASRVGEPDDPLTIQRLEHRYDTHRVQLSAIVERSTRRRGKEPT